VSTCPQAPAPTLTCLAPSAQVDSFCRIRFNDRSASIPHHVRARDPYRCNWLYKILFGIIPGMFADDCSPLARLRRGAAIALQDSIPCPQCTSIKCCSLLTRARALGRSTELRPILLTKRSRRARMTITERLPRAVIAFLDRWRRHTTPSSGALSRQRLS